MQLSVEAYIELHRALTKQSDVVQPVSPIEECYYKVNDLRQLLQLHGYTAASKFKKQELFAALQGQKLINPCSSTEISVSSSGPHNPAEPTSTGQQLPFTASDACAVLGTTCSRDPQPVRFLQLGPASSFHAGPPAPAVAEGGVACTLPAPPAAPHADIQQAHPEQQQQHQQKSHDVPAQQPAASQLQQQQQPLQEQQPVPLVPQACLPVPGASAPTDPLHELLSTLLSHNPQSLPGSNQLPVQRPPSIPPQLQPNNAIAAALLQQLLFASAANTPAAVAQQPGAPNNTQNTPASAAAVLHTPTEQAVAAPAAHHSSTAAAQAPSSSAQQEKAAPADVPEPVHTPWLKTHLQWLAANGMRVARSAGAAAAASGDAGALLGRRVGFMLLEEMQVAGLRDTLLTLPAGFYEGMTSKYLGSSCQDELCEHNCPAQHQFYRARILSPRALPEPASSTDPALAASLAQAQSATSGRPVLLTLDLHPRLRAHSLESLLHISTPEQLQDAWLLLEGEQEGVSSPPVPYQAMAASAPAGKRGRDGGAGKAGHTKRAKGRPTA